MILQLSNNQHNNGAFQLNNDTDSEETKVKKKPNNMEFHNNSYLNVEANKDDIHTFQSPEKSYTNHKFTFNSNPCPLSSQFLSTPKEEIETTYNNKIYRENKKEMPKTNNINFITLEELVNGPILMTLQVEEFKNSLINKNKYSSSEDTIITNFAVNLSAISLKTLYVDLAWLNANIVIFYGNNQFLSFQNE